MPQPIRDNRSTERAIHHIYLVGAGIYSTLHLTKEAAQVLSKCRRAYCLLDDLDLVEAIGGLGPETIDLLDIYDLALLRPAIYDRIAEILATTAAAGVAPIALVTHGHPLFLVSASERIIARAEGMGLSVGLVSGISSFDTLMSDLREDFGYGFQAYDATSLVLDDHPINTKVPLLVFQVANTMCLEPQAAPPPPSTLDPLLTKLRRHYPADHLITFVTSATKLLDEVDRYSVRLDDDAGLTRVQLWKRPTIYVAAL